MILIYYFNGRYAPVIVCDMCQQRITNAEMAVAVGTQVVGQETDLIQVLHAHKGKCHDEAEKKLGGVMKTGWEELTQHLLYLIENVGLEPQKLVEWRKLLDDAGA